MIDVLRTFPLFEDLSEDQLRWLAAEGEEVAVEAGTRLFEEGKPVEHFYVLLEGEVEVLKRFGLREHVAITSAQPGAWVGAIPVVDEAYQVGARAGKPSRFFRLSNATMRHALMSGFPMAKHLLLGVRSGTERFQSQIQQHEKLTALGKMAAGLAHELNNPASSARRAAGDLRAALLAHEKASLALASEPGVVGCRPHLDGLTLDLTVSSRTVSVLSPLERGDREDELGQWLDRHGVPDAWGVAPALVEANCELRWLDELVACVPAEALAKVIDWVVSRVTTTRLIDDIESSTARISELVHAVKDYSYMDRDTMQEVDVHQGLETTLTILGHKLRQSGIQVERRYAADLPHIWAHGSALNQVWTNLIDNAIDALDGPGHIRITTARHGDDVVVEVSDDGPGVPAEIQRRIFEPFFTTKDPGKGTGLGLDAVYASVVQDHGGSISLDSRPGSTTFTVRLPISGTAGGQR